MERVHKSDRSPQCYSRYGVFRAMCGLNGYTVFKVKALGQENGNLNVEGKN